MPNNLSTVAFIFLVFSCRTIVCHNDILWSVLLFHRLHFSLPVPQSFPLLLHWLQITPLSLGREQYLFLGNIENLFPGNQLLARLSSGSCRFVCLLLTQPVSEGADTEKEKVVLKTPIVLQVEKYLEFYTVLTFHVICFSSRHLI